MQSGMSYCNVILRNLHVKSLVRFASERIVQDAMRSTFEETGPRFRKLNWKPLLVLESCEF